MKTKKPKKSLGKSLGVIYLLQKYVILAEKNITQEKTAINSQADIVLNFVQKEDVKNRQSDSRKSSLIFYLEGIGEIVPNFFYFTRFTIRIGFTNSITMVNH
jgi:hypothetical protein